MAQKDRIGNRKIREQRKPFKVQELGYYLIVTNTEATERCYFEGLHQALPEDVRNRLVIKVMKTKTRTMISVLNSLLTMHNIVFLGLYLTETKYKSLMR